MLCGSVKRAFGDSGASDAARVSLLHSDEWGGTPVGHPISSADTDGYRKGSDLDAEGP